MTADTGALAERRRLALQVAAALGMDLRQLRPVAAVHEAGHAIVAATVGFTVSQAWVGDPAEIGCDIDGVEVDLSSYAGLRIPLPDLLAMKAAGYQATFTWLQGLGVDGNAPPYDRALNTLAGHDISYCLDTCRQLGRPDLSMQDGLEGARRILALRWDAVIGLADALASQGVLAEAGLQPYLTAGPAHHAEAASSYRAWRHLTNDLWRQQPGKPAEVWLSESAGNQETGKPARS